MSATEPTDRIAAGDANSEVREMHRVYELQRAAFLNSPPPDRKGRLESLDRLARMLSSRCTDFAAAISADFGTRAVHETYLLELIPLQNALRHAKQNLADWMRPQPRRVGLVFKPGKAWVQFQPLGVVGIIAPWNYPLSLALLPVVDALAAGNRILLKPSEVTSRLAHLLKKFVGEIFAEDQFAVLTGGPEMAEQFCRLPLDHLMFTGSTAVGRRVMAAAAENLTPVTLELGGKSPVVVCPDYDVRRAARDLAYGKLATAGQTCIAPDYALAPEAKVRDLADAVIARARQMYPSIPSNPEYSSIVNDRHYERLRNAIEEARRGGAEILSHSDPPRQSRKIGPTVVLRAPPDCALMREEIFGPVLPIIGYETIDQALAKINAQPRPLALYCLTGDRRYRDQVLSRTISGGVTVNGTFSHNGIEDLPFGGAGPSGIGAYHGIAGFERFSHARSVYQTRGYDPMQMVAPPYGKFARLLIRLLGSRRAADSL
jgi:coniferyl-aldehyde dehydrogenase